LLKYRNRVCRIEYDSPGAFSFEPFKVRRWHVVAGPDPGYLPASMTVVPAASVPMVKFAGGFRIECRGCGKPFESLGWAYCSKPCKAKSAEPVRGWPPTK
jgi:hypothetical protein